MNTRRNNVTPFRPRRKEKRSAGERIRTPRGQVLLMHGLTLIGFGLSIANRIFFAGSSDIWLSSLPWIALALGVAAVAIAASQRETGMPWTRTHHEMGLRTILIGAVAMMLASLLGFIPFINPFIGLVILAIGAWVGLRASYGFIAGFLRLPMPRPRSLLI